MRRRDLANQLVSASTSRERRELIQTHRTLADLRLAREIKEICYSRWTAEPIVARQASAALSILLAISPDSETAAISFWINGIAKITQSRFQQAVEKLDSAASIFDDIGKPVDAAQTKVAKLIALALLGRYKEADEAGRAALAVFENARDQLSAGKIEMNLSNVAARREMHREAERYALSALGRFKQIDERTWQTMAENDLANTYAEINRFREAEKYFAMAAQSAKAAGMRLTEAEIEASMGNLEMFRGRFADALRYLELSRQKYEELGLPHQTAIAELEISEIYAELNLVSEAISMLRPLTERLKKLHLRADEARARTLLARLLTHEGEYQAALKELGRARRIFLKENNLVGTARTDVLRADVMIRTFDFTSAEAALEQASQFVKNTGNKRLRITADWLRAETKRLRGQNDDSRDLLNSVVKEAKIAEVPAIAAAGLTALGRLESSIGNLTAAKTAFKRAMKLIETMRAPIASDEFKMSFLAGQLEPYNELFKIAVAEGKIDEAFALHESARARSLVEAAGPITATHSSNKLARKLSDIREELNWFYSRLSRANVTEITEIEKHIESREKQITKLNRQLESLEANRGQPPKTFELAELQTQLNGDTALTEYVELNGSIAAFVVTKESIDLIERLGNVGEIRQQLEGLRFQFGTLRFGAATIQSFLPQLKRSTDHHLALLHDALILPLAHLISDKKLVIAPAGVLNYVPFNALFDGGKYLIERHLVSITPSADMWLKLDRRHGRKMGIRLLMGYSDESIPFAEAEIRDLKTKLKGDAIALTGRRATFNGFVNNASKADLIHLACHGQFRSDNPMFSSLHLADGWVTVRDIARQKLKARLVTLSACETGLSEVHKGEELLGLTRGFLSAGAQNLIVSLWTVNDESTSRLMLELYGNLQRGNTPSASLRAAQLEFIRNGTHPYYWSTFVVIGK